MRTPELLQQPRPGTRPVNSPPGERVELLTAPVPCPDATGLPGNDQVQVYDPGTATPGMGNNAQDGNEPVTKRPSRTDRVRQQKPQRVIETASLEAIAEIVAEYELSSAGIGEWAGLVEGRPTVVRLVSRTRVARSQLERTVTAVTARAERLRSDRTRRPTRTGGSSSNSVSVERLTAAARRSRWF